jgi:phosphoenolpyruvate---glycerone phosphotransferase subunit DhaL
MAMRITDIVTCVERAKRAMVTLKQELNQADAVLGDGDTGGMLARVIANMAQANVADAGDVGTGFATLAKVALAGTGSSLGTLLATGLMVFARETKGETEVSWARLGGLLGMARDAMIARGGAHLGDKTVLDGIDAVARACEGLSDPSAIASAARKAANEALEVFRDKPCEIGRARMFAEKSIGKDDPGMLAFASLTDAVTTT